MGIRQLEARKLEALREYHRIEAECDAEIEAIRAKRGAKIKQPDFGDVCYLEPGKHYIHHSPYGDF